MRRYGVAPYPRAAGVTTGAICAIVGVATIVLAATGCNVGPDFRPLSPPPIEAQYANLSGQTSDDPAELAAWWSVFRDPVLDDLMHAAVCENFDLQEARHRVEEARALVRFAGGNRAPRIDGTSGYTRRQVSSNANQFVASNNALRPIDLFSAGFDSSWELDLWGKLRRGAEAAGARLEANRFDYCAVQVTLLGDVAATYINVRTLQERLSIARDNLAAQERVLKLVEHRLGAGLVDELDAAQARTNVYATAAEIPLIEQDLSVSLHRLAVLLGRGPSSDLAESLGVGAIPRAPDQLAAGAPADLLRRRPDVRRTEMETADQCAKIGVAVADLFPQFSLIGTVSVDSRDFSNWFASNSLAYGVGPSVRWHLLHFGRVKANIAAQEARYLQAAAKYRQTVLKAAAEVEDGLAAWQDQSRRSEQFVLGAAAARTAVKLSTEKYEQGLIAFQTVLDSQRQSLELENDLAASRGEAALAVVRTYKALGGGWTPPECAP